MKIQNKERLTGLTLCQENTDLKNEKKKNLEFGLP